MFWRTLPMLCSVNDSTRAYAREAAKGQVRLTAAEKERELGVKPLVATMVKEF
jgi:hypothetical protein